tara:strand:- start:86 stop:919 length:834 start_codon:yes stop_codon:yes gene_type:complete
MEEKKKGRYKYALLFPLALLIIALLILGQNYTSTGSFVKKGISLEGGTSISIASESIGEITIPYEGQTNIRTLSGAGKNIGIVIEMATTDAEEIQAITDYIKSTHGITEQQLNVETIGSSLGASFFKETIRAMIIAFVLMGVVVFIYFRKILPSITIIVATVSDILITLAILNLINIHLSTAGVAALLMMIGYAVDTNILLSTKVLKKKEGTVDERIREAFGTGIMMSFTTIVALLAALFFTQSDVIAQIMLILIIGLVIDLINTWVMNANVLRWYV